MRANIVDNQWIHFDNITTAEEEILWVDFSVSRPGIYIDPSQMGNWDGIFRKYNRGKKRIARPLLSMLRGICKKRDLPLVVHDEREPWAYSALSPDEINNDFLKGITLDQHQVDCLRKAVRCECGIISVPTGGGKGELIAGLCKAIPCPTIILADQRVVLDQLKARLELRDVSSDVGLFYAGKRPNGQLIIVGSIQSLMVPSKIPELPVKKQGESEEKFQSRYKRWDSTYKAYQTRRANVRELLKYVREAEMVIVDECDRACGDAWKSLFRHYFRGRRRFGLSGTPFDDAKPVEAVVVQELLGSIIYKTTREHLTEIGRIIPCSYKSIVVGMDGDIKEASAYDIAYDEHITDSRLFHQLVAQLCLHCKKSEGDGTLIIVDRERLGLNLQAAIAATGLKVDFIYGKTSIRHRKEALRRFEKRESDVLIGGKIINRGLDLSGGCENLIIATGGKLQSDFIQKVGRAVRHNRKGKSTIYDFFFRCNRYLYGHSKARLKAMIATNYKTSVVFPGGVVDGTDFVNSRFRVKQSLFGSV